MFVFTGWGPFPTTCGLAWLRGVTLPTPTAFPFGCDPTFLTMLPSLLPQTKSADSRSHNVLTSTSTLQVDIRLGGIVSDFM